MSNLLKTGFLLGIGAAVSSKEKVDKYVDDLLAKGKVTPKEADELYQSLLKKGEETEEQWNQRSKEKMRSIMDDLNIISREEFLQLQERVDQLEKKLTDQVDNDPKQDD
ncbi:phasin family protein [Salipaludibacillus sp. HK11]|uniref:phasin family protein n=1 Tax=Salipaludibacillus sp. HK11 TaxID=3394320 RepID=UPI0039FBD6EE